MATDSCGERSLPLARRRSRRIAEIWILASGAIDDDAMRGSLAAALLLASAPAAARADVTIFYSAPAVHAGWVAVPVRAAASSAPPSPSARSSDASVEAPARTSPLAPSPAEEPAARREDRTPAPPPTPVAARPTSSGCTPPSPVRFVRMTDGSHDVALLHLTTCRGEPEPDALRQLSILARPRTAERPTPRELAIHEADPDFLAPDVHRLDPGLLVRLQRLADAFPGHDIEITSGYRPDARETSQHRVGHALDLRIDGVPIDDVHAVALTFDESGVGLYPTSEFLHLDVRPRVTRWVDVSGPGERSEMVEVVTGRDGLAANTPPLRWTRESTPARPPSAPRAGRGRARAASLDDDARADIRRAVEALEGLDLHLP